MASLSLHLEVGCLGQAEWLVKQPVPTAQVKCCGWVSPSNWTDNPVLMNSTKTTYPCSCEKMKEEDNQLIVKKGFCESDNSTASENRPEDWPVHPEVCGAGSRELDSTTLREAGGPAPECVRAVTQAYFLVRSLLPVCSHLPLQVHGVSS